MIELVLKMLFFFFAGLTLKLGDDFIDELKIPHIAVPVFVICGLLMGYLMATSEWDLVLFTAIVIGVLLSGKVNDSAYISGFGAIGIMLLFFGLPLITDILEWLTILILLFIAAVLDERGNDWIDRTQSTRAALLFQYRFVLKLTALLLAIPWPEFFLTAIGLWVFDGGYELAGWAVRRNQ
jgi:hypothetical protein